MKNDYEVLELDEGATPEEIKRAYFSLVRAYPPEENPEKFREIREAYEHLKKTGGKGKQQGPVFEKMTDSQALQMLSYIQKCQQKGDVKLVRDACEEARRRFPDELQFMYLLAIAQRKAGNTGKAVKNFEELVRLHPQNMWFWKELAVSYMERGFTKKAYGAFEKAYELGCRENDFILMFSVECNNYGQQEMGIKILQEMLQKQERWERDQIPELLEAYTGLCIMTLDGDEKEFLHILDKMEEDFSRYSVYMEENQEQIFSIFVMLLLQDKQSSITGIKKLKKICAALEKGFRSKEAKEELQSLQSRILMEEIYADDRLSDTIKRGSDLFFDFYFGDEQMNKYGWLDVQLCMIEERDEVLLQEEILREEYPAYYEKISAFFEELRNAKNLAYIKEKLLKQYIRFSEYMKGGYYFEKYPQEEKRRGQGTVFYDTETMPYVRNEKKVGRNEPCPCGSGKKYKHCCGKN